MPDARCTMHEHEHEHGARRVVYVDRCEEEEPWLHKTIKEEAFIEERARRP